MTSWIFLWRFQFMMKILNIKLLCWTIAIAIYFFIGTHLPLKKFAYGKTSLIKDTDGDVSCADFSYNSVVGLLLYLSRHSWPDIAYTINSAACYIFCPRQPYQLVLRRIWKGIMLNLSSNLKIDCYPDPNFSGIYGYEKITNPACVSRNGYVITVADCPKIWQS